MCAHAFWLSFLPSFRPSLVAARILIWWLLAPCLPNAIDSDTARRRVNAGLGGTYGVNHGEIDISLRIGAAYGYFGAGLKHI